jgi:copper chaperone CopZ
LAGIKKVNGDLGAGTITVIYDAQQTTPEQIAQAINRSGFQVIKRIAP